ncbi:bifunctional riboflavin kinase/FAD synthetase [Legionella septentrionalis]|uniref:Riboflavin biosynthesis protein n=1 Tax=Legionella septentrionalis TaxID=2498109 RepID=A0A3S1CLZ4_9GAMM|nr:bifunctional riboflavin kinase/FAD synthetase [Legionella septentrionalis]RUQ89444.1 bifunctional riboflavin kinase/FAD synthetase [Legionella septentrionalis]
MKLLRGLQDMPALCAGTVLTIGNFDGVHRGHQALLNELRSEARRLQLPLTVILFEPQPGEYFQGSAAPARLATLREKINELKKYGVDYVYCLKFNRDLALMPPAEFAEKIIFSLLQAKYILIGRDFRFGKERGGDVALLQELAKKWNSTVEMFPDFATAGERISSTKIRQALAENQLERAAEFLGRRYAMCGRVVPGNGLGRQWGIPTANLCLNRRSLPIRGVFCVYVQRKGRLFPAVANLGCRPTVDGVRNLLEIHLLDFNEMIYGEILQVIFLHKLRDESKFSSLDALIAQIKQDIAATKNYFNRVISVSKS